MPVATQHLPHLGKPKASGSAVAAALHHLPARRAFLKHSLALLGLAVLSACGRREALLRVGTNTFPGYEFMHAAALLGYFDRKAIRMIRFPASTQVIHGVATGDLDALGLTLDELLTARAQGLALRAIAVLDISMGADKIYARPGLQAPEDYRDKVFYLEKTAGGALMIDAFLRHLGLGPQDVRLRYAAGDKLIQAYVNGEADAVVIFSPAHIALERAGASLVFDSRAIPGRIIDVLAATELAIAEQPLGLSALIEAHFRAQAAYHAGDPHVKDLLSRGLRLASGEIDSAFAGLDLPDLNANRAWFLGESPALSQSAAGLAQTMVHAGLLPADRVELAVQGVLDDRFH